MEIAGPRENERTRRKIYTGIQSAGGQANEGGGRQRVRAGGSYLGVLTGRGGK